MYRIYKAAGIASAQDMKDQLASAASLHARVAQLETDLRQTEFILERVQQAAVKLQNKLYATLDR
jgi:outer membrane murein-binding lipoprotein Lpp